MNNQDVAKLFKNVAAAYAIKDEKKFRFQILAYQKASEAIAGSTSELKDLYKEDKLNSVPGIGSTIKSRIEELFRKGHVEHFDSVLEGIPGSVFVLLDVPSLGPKKAYKLTSKFSLTNPKTVVDSLINEAKEGNIAKIPTFGEKSQEDILTALLEYKQGKNKTERMVLPYASEIADKIIEYLKKSSAINKVATLGSLRRRMPTVGDIDIAAASDNPKEAIDHFVSYPYKERIIEKGPSTASFLTSGGKQVDFMVQPVEGFGALLQHFTGSKNHNVHLREYALKKGMSLSERGIKDLSKKDGRIRSFDSEEKFYKALGMQWIPPELRENKGEIELAANNKLPFLVELRNIRGDLHIHSSFPIEPSHDLGNNSIKEMVQKANYLNYEYIGFSEHNPNISRHTNKQIYDLIAKRNDEIEQIKSSIKSVRIIKLLEIDILPAGDLAVDNKSIDLLDASIVSIHSGFNMEKKKLTDRILKGLSHPKVKILAHPTGRLLNERAGYDLEWDKIFDFCKKNNKAIEINAWPLRLDLPDVLVKEAIKYGVKFVINTDSHAVDQMNLMKYGVDVARRGWATKNDILNTLSYNKFIEWIKK